MLDLVEKQVRVIQRMRVCSVSQPAAFYHPDRPSASAWQQARRRCCAHELLARVLCVTRAAGCSLVRG
jgi:hypothetical protein